MMIGTQIFVSFGCFICSLHVLMILPHFVPNLTSICIGWFVYFYFYPVHSWKPFVIPSSLRVPTFKVLKIILTIPLGIITCLFDPPDAGNCFRDSKILLGHEPRCAYTLEC